MACQSERRMALAEIDNDLRIFSTVDAQGAR
jgi:hypothetical protein